MPAGSGPLDEEKEPHFLAGKSRISTLDYDGAIECFEKALQTNPQSASAHFELAWLFDVKEPDPAAAIYHYQHYLKLRPDAGNADVVKQRVMVCKQALAESVSLGPLTEKMQRQFEQMVETNKYLLEENRQLHEALEKWSAYAARLQTMTNAVASQPPALQSLAALNPANTRDQPARIPASATNSIALANVGSAGSASAPSRTHTVRAGETAGLIAKRYGVKLSALLAANPNLEPRRLKVGQVLRVPGS